MRDVGSRIVFLDYDGVMVCLPRMVGRKPVTGGAVRNANPEPVGQLNRIIDATGAKVVVSSSWRMHHSVKFLWGTLGRVGFRGEIIGVTVDLSANDTLHDGVWHPVPRGDEVQHWLTLHPAVTSYVVLDDDDDRGPIPAERWITVHDGWFSGGLLAEHADAAIAVLRGDTHQG